ncbi:type 1 fimbrial protein [Salmonella enterica]|nr:type 1 fimbrial protein [Salmonella enterica]
MNTMLKMSAVAMVMMGAMQMAQAAPGAAPTAKPLTLNVKGVITTLTCDLSADVSANTVDLGIAFPSQFGGAAGTKVGNKTFHLQTVNCQQDGGAADVGADGDLVASVGFGADEVVNGNGQWYDATGPKDAAIVIEGEKLDTTAAVHVGKKSVLTTGDKIFFANGTATAPATTVASLNGQRTELEAYMVSLTAANPTAQTLSVPVTFTAMYQ